MGRDRSPVRERRDRRHRSRSRSPVRRRDRERSPVERERESRRDHERRSPVHNGRRTRSRSPRERRHRNKDARQRSRSRSPHSTSNRDRERERDRSKRERRDKTPPKIDLTSVATAEDDMMSMMGFGGFDTTKNKKVEGNVGGFAKVNKPRKFRQYMNRKGGFNRPLDYIS